jgi:transcriptional regulator with XRE-family HTH domain
MTPRGKPGRTAKALTPSLQGLGARLRAALNARHKSKLYAAASDLGVSQSAVSRWQNGGRISLQNLILICEYLDVSADWLLLNRGSVYAHRTSSLRELKPTREDQMTEERLALSELLKKARDGDCLRRLAESVLQLLIQIDVEARSAPNATRGSRPRCAESDAEKVGR